MAEYPPSSQSEYDDPWVAARFYNPAGPGVWLLLDYNPETKMAYGFIIGLGYNGPGYISMRELEAIRFAGGFKIKRDYNFEPAELSNFINEDWLFVQPHSVFNSSYN
ncbi:MAG: DUF2958 domain-containing protein [SAR324 cluster bacterium]|nr:DUF2958 domain-containing protein [SAR324 cluster bacterium]